MEYNLPNMHLNREETERKYLRRNLVAAVRFRHRHPPHQSLGEVAPSHRSHPPRQSPEEAARIHRNHLHHQSPKI